jgi:hypothetical protein
MLLEFRGYSKYKTSTQKSSFSFSFYSLGLLFYSNFDILYKGFVNHRKIYLSFLALIFAVFIYRVGNK